MECGKFWKTKEVDFNRSVGDVSKGGGGGADKKGVQKSIERPVCDSQQNDDMYPSQVLESLEFHKF